MYGTADIRFPIEDIEAMYRNAPGPKELWLLDGVSHGIARGGVPEAGYAQYRDNMRAFLEAKAPACLEALP